MSICYVTAFVELNRNKWRRFSKQFSTYLLHFLPLVRLIKKEDKSRLIIFMDEKRFNIISRCVQDIPNITLVKINRNYLFANSQIWRMLDTEKEIMSSMSYKRLMGKKILFPRHYNAEYTIMNHSKIDFVGLAIQFTKSEFPYYCWIDFGYFQKIDNIPNSLLDLNKLDLEKITYTLINKLNDKDRGTLYTLLKSPENIDTSFFFGKKENLLEYQLFYHYILDLFQKSNIADHDKHVVLKCYYIRPLNFQLVLSGGSNKALKIFQK